MGDRWRRHHEVSILIAGKGGVGRYFGSQPRAKVSMMISTILFLVLVVISVLLGPETKGKTLTADLEVVKVAAQPAT